MAWLARVLPLDPYVISLLLTVGVASVLPASGAWAQGMTAAVGGAIFLLFFFIWRALGTA
ncbi:hypothetical protein [Pararhodospirillum photometricum]|nr:hypothetical protein [Pararhodospirillum photometricum]